MQLLLENNELSNRRNIAWEPFSRNFHFKSDGGSKTGGSQRSLSQSEIKRNFWADDAFPKKYAGYFGKAAHQRTQQRRSTYRKLILCKTVIARIKQGWTPEQIGNRMIFEGAELRVCQETIYRYIYSKEGMEQELWWYLPEHRKARRPRRAIKRQKPKFDRDVSILFRPDDVSLGLMRAYFAGQ